MQRGEMTDAVCSALDSCSLNVLERPDGRPRHAGGGHAQREIGDAQLQLTLADKLEDIVVKCGNLGFAVRGASDVIAHGLQVMRELNADTGILTTEVGLPRVFLFPTSRPWGPGSTNSEHPFIDFGLASSPKSQLLKIAKTQKQKP
jgi:hypothetical protein